MEPEGPGGRGELSKQHPLDSSVRTQALSSSVSLGGNHSLLWDSVFSSIKCRGWLRGFPFLALRVCEVTLSETF